MKRRSLFRLTGGALAAAGGSSPIVQAEELRARRIGILASSPLHPIQSLKQRLAELGWVEGTNAYFTERWAQADDTAYPALASALATLPVDIIVTWGTPALLAAKRATANIPIVMAGIGDPVAVGAVSRLDRPGGNVTGFSTQNFELEGKRLELLREIVPSAKRIAALGNRGNPYSAAAMASVRVAAAGSLELLPVEADAGSGLDDALTKMRASNPDAVLILSIPAFIPDRRKITEFMATNQLPAIYPYPEFVEAGGLMCYATNFDDLFRRAADYVDKILRGAPAGELPVQQATAFLLIVNLRVARALGLTFPELILAGADEVIE